MGSITTLESNVPCEPVLLRGPDFPVPLWQQMDGLLRYPVTLLMWSRESAPMRRHPAAPNLFAIPVWNW
jgi:hypothetical protein